MDLTEKRTAMSATLVQRSLAKLMLGAVNTKEKRCTTPSPCPPLLVPMRMSNGPWGLTGNERDSPPGVDIVVAGDLWTHVNDISTHLLVVKEEPWLKFRQGKARVCLRHQRIGDVGNGEADGGRARGQVSNGQAHKVLKASVGFRAHSHGDKQVVMAISVDINIVVKAEQNDFLCGAHMVFKPGGEGGGILRHRNGWLQSFWLRR
eukprot:1145384-Pelagomonas_calceolata.AAC.5